MTEPDWDNPFAQQERGLFTPESELALIAAVMTDARGCEDVLDATAATVFSDPVHASIWTIARDIVRDGGIPAPSIVADKIGKSRAFDDWGGLGRLYDLAETGTIAALAEHAAAVADRSGRRALKRLLDDVGSKVLNTAAGDHLALLGELESGAAEIARSGSLADQFVSAGEMVADALRHAQNRAGRIDFPFGIAKLDALSGGLTPGETTVLGAWTGMGKSLAGTNSARANASMNNGTCYFSLEMGAVPMGLRMACDLAYDRRALSYSGLTTNPTIDAAAQNRLAPHQWERLWEAQRTLNSWPLLFDTRPGLTMAQIEAAARRAHRRWERRGIKPGPVFIDHIGKVRPSKNRRGDPTAEMSDKSAEAADMAKRLDVPVVIMAQLNREVDKQGEDKRPQLSHLKQSNALAEDARQVVFLYRPEYYYREPLEHEGLEKKAERLEKLRKVEHHFYWLLEKASNGPRGQTLSFCQASCNAIRDWDPQ